MKPGQRRQSSGRYVNDSDLADWAWLATLMSELAQQAPEPAGWPPGPCMRDFGPLWAKCPGGRPCDERDECACAPARELAIWRAHMEVLEMRSGK